MADRNPIIPNRADVKEFNPHHGREFAYNRLLLVDERIDAEIAILGAADLNLVERRLLNLCEAIKWLIDHPNR